MPLLYLCPSRTRAEPFTTTYRVFVGNGALFEKDRDTGVAGVTDGTANTIMVAEAKEAVPWTKPDDLPFDPAGGSPSAAGALARPHRGVIVHAAMANSLVRFIKNTIDPGVFRALITRASGRGGCKRAELPARIGRSPRSHPRRSKTSLSLAPGCSTPIFTAKTPRTPRKRWVNLLISSSLRALGVFAVSD